MKKTFSAVAWLLCLCFIVPFIPAGAASVPDGVETLQLVDTEGETASAYSYNGYKTWTMANATLLSIHADKTVGGTTCSSMQGMNVGTSYIYTAKRNSADSYVQFARTTISSGAVTYMSYYSSTSSTTATGCNTCGHANDMVVVTADSVNYMYVATTDKGKAITRLKISGTGLYFTGYFNLVNSSGTQISASSIRQYKHSGGYFYFIIKNGETFYYCKIADSASGGTASAPTSVTCYKIFTIDKRNAVFAKSSSSAGTYANMETWVNQGFGYNPQEKTIYVPMFKPGSPITVNVIITFYVGDVLTDELMDFSTNRTTLLFPTKTSFYLKASDYSSSCTTLEVESAGFRTGQGTTGDLKMYINANASPVSSYEGTYSLSYTSGSGDFTSIVNDSSVVYTVKYNANGGTDSGTNSSAGNYKMSNTRHVYGISTNLRPNYFTRSGYTFAGWYLTRKSDGKWLYFDADGTARWYLKGSQPDTSRLALYGDKRTVSKLTGVNGDVVTCYAQWTPNSTGTTSYYMKYDANGGSGTMEDTKVVYGTSTKLTANTFTRSGYVFTGWIAHRRSDDSWAYKTSSLTDKWIVPGNDTTGLFFKTYADGCSVSATTGTDRDIITLYAAWARVAGGVYPTSLKENTGFTLGGTVEADSGIYTVTVAVKDSGGNVVASHSASPLATSYDLSAANADISFSSLPVGSYSYVVQMQTVNGSAAKTHTLLNTAFEIVAAARLQLTSVAETTGLYTLGTQYFEGFGQKATVSQLKALFEYEVAVADYAGTAVADGDVVGTGCVISCGGESRIAVLRGDINGDSFVSTIDYLTLSSSVKTGSALSGAYFAAADLNYDDMNSAADCIAIKKLLTE